MQQYPSSTSSKVTEVDVPLYFQDKTILGKARIIEGDGEDAVLIELEATNPKMAALMKTGLIGMCLVNTEGVAASASRA